MGVNVNNILRLYDSSFKPRTHTKLLVIHCSATRPLQDIGAREIHRWHMGQGFSAIGYHYVIRRDGTIERGRPMSAVGAHVRGYNSSSVGICLVGGVDVTGKAASNFTLYQMEMLRQLLIELRRIYPTSLILGHRDLSPDRDGDGVVERHEWLKECPSFDVRQWLAGVSL